VLWGSGVRVGGARSRSVTADGETTAPAQILIPILVLFSRLFF
jgi:hypothetical protein